MNLDLNNVKLVKDKFQIKNIFIDDKEIKGVTKITYTEETDAVNTIIIEMLMNKLEIEDINEKETLKDKIKELEEKVKRLKGEIKQDEWSIVGWTADGTLYITNSNTDEIEIRKEESQITQKQKLWLIVYETELGTVNIYESFTKKETAEWRLRVTELNAAKYGWTQKYYLKECEVEL